MRNKIRVTVSKFAVKNPQQQHLSLTLPEFLKCNLNLLCLLIYNEQYKFL